MASSSAWGIEIGSFALKAMRLERQGDGISIADYVVIPHRKALSTPDVDADEMTRLSLGQFLSQQPEMRSGPVLVSVPGNGAFARFAKLPPVEPKKVPDIVKFEAVQQIPFPIEEVEWDYETFMQEDSPEVEVGIFAITKGAVQARLNLYSELGLYPDGITMSPLGVYNAIHFDQDLENSTGGVIILDIGTSSSDIIIAEGGRVWIRTFPIGGHAFTEALIQSFKLTYSKAERLKAEAQTSKYRRQILSALRPVFGELAQEVQRSIGYYQSLHKDADLTRLVGVGSTFKLPGLRKFLSQQVQMEVSRLDEFAKLPAGSNPQLAEHALNGATAYGLALQGMGLAPLEVNLISTSVVRDRMWSGKIKWFGAAAALVVFGSMVAFARPLMDSGYVDQDPNVGRDIDRVIATARGIKQDFDTVKTETEITAKPANIRAMLDNRDIWPHVLSDVSEMLASSNPQPELFSGDGEQVAAIPPGERRLLELQQLDYTFLPPMGEETRPSLELRMRVQSSNKNGVSLVNQSVIAWLENNAQRDGVPYRILTGDQATRPEIVRRDEMKTADAVEPPPGSDPGRFGTPRGGGFEGGGFEGGGERGSGMEQVFSPRGGSGMEMGGRGGERGGGFSPMSGSPFSNSDTSALDAIAPLPESPLKLPPSTTYYQIEVRWTIQIIDPASAATPGAEEGGI